MGVPATLRVNIIGDARGVGPAVAQTERGLARLSRGMRAASAAAHTFVTGAVFAAAARGMLDMARGAAEAEQNIGALQAVFKQASGQAEAFADGAARAVGLSKSAYAQIAALVGSQLKQAGVPMGELAGQTDRLVKLGADLAAQFGGSTKQAMEAISSLFRGEADPIERYAVSIKQSAVNAELAARGQSKLTGAARLAAEQQARIKLLFEQTADAHGRFNEEAGTASGQWQRLNARWEDTKNSLGEKLLPYLVKAGEALGALVGLIEAHPDVFTALAVGLGVAAAAMLVMAVNTALATGGLSLVIPLIAGAIAALVAIGAKFYEQSEPFRQFIDKVKALGKAFVEGFMDKVREGWKRLQPDIEKLKQKFEEFWTKLQPIVKDLEPWARRLGEFLGGSFIGSLSIAINWLSSMLDYWGWIIDKIRSVIDWLKRIRWPEPPGWLRKLLDKGGSLFDFGNFGGPPGFAFDPASGAAGGMLLRGITRAGAAALAAAGAPQVTVNVYVDDPRLKDLIRVEVDGAQTTLARRILAGRAI